MLYTNGSWKGNPLAPANVVPSLASATEIKDIKKGSWHDTTLSAVNVKQQSLNLEISVDSSRVRASISLFVTTVFISLYLCL